MTPPPSARVLTRFCLCTSLLALSPATWADCPTWAQALSVQATSSGELYSKVFFKGKTLYTCPPGYCLGGTIDKPYAVCHPD